MIQFWKNWKRHYRKLDYKYLHYHVDNSLTLPWSVIFHSTLPFILTCSGYIKITIILEIIFGNIISNFEKFSSLRISGNKIEKLVKVNGIIYENKLPKISLLVYVSDGMNLNRSIFSLNLKWADSDLISFLSENAKNGKKSRRASLPLDFRLFISTNRISRITLILLFFKLFEL